MNKTKSSSELKRNAKEILLGHYNIVIPALLMITIFSLLVNNLSSTIYSTQKTSLSFLLYVLFLILSSLLLEVFSIGRASLFLNLMTNREPKLNNIYNGFKMDPKRSLILCGFYSLLLGITGFLPLLVFQKFFYFNAAIEIIIVISLLVLFGMLLSIFIILSFSQIFFLINDFPTASAWDTIKYSYQIMKGNKGRLFYIHLSFIPWYLLSILTCGIALLWIMPYFHSTLALFYLDLINKQ